MATIEEQFAAQSQRFADEFNTLRANEMGARIDLVTPTKTTLVLAINEIYGMLTGALPSPGSVINDDVTGLATTWSSDKLSAKFMALPPAGAQINDITVANTTVWSSTKTKAMIDESAGGVIDDTATTTENTWSATKISQAIAAGGGGGGGAVIDDTTTALDKVWSSSKTNTAIQAALASAPPYTLPPATTTVLGGIKVGQFLAVDLNGVLRVNMTKGDIGLGNVDNTSDANKPVSTAQATAISNAVAGVTKASIGLGNVDNTSDVNKPVSTAQTAAINAAVAGVTKASLGLGAVDNTSDANKPVSTAQAAADAAVLANANAYADSKVAGLLDLRGFYNASSNTFPTSANNGSGTAGAVLKGDYWIINAAGTLGGTPVISGQSVVAVIDAPGQTAANWGISAAGGAVSDAIVDGVVNMAPSQNAVFDALLLKQDKLSAGDATQYRKGDNTLGTMDKAAVGLGNVDNTSDANKPVSTAQAAADAATLAAAVITALDEGSALAGGAAVRSINIVGAGATASQIGGALTLTIPGAGSSLTSTDQLVEGLTNLYYTDARTRAAVMTGISFVTGTAVVAGDTVLQAVGKLQAQATAGAAATAAISKTSIGLGNVENKDSATIRGELTAANVNAALTYTAGRVITALDEGSALASGAAVQSINIVGAGATATQTGGNLTLTIPGSSGPSSTDGLAEGTTNLYFLGSRVLSAVLTGLSTATNAVITASDSVVTALGKLQKQITDLAASVITTSGVATLTNKTLDNCIITGFRETGVAASGTSCAISYLTGTNTEYTTTGNTTVVLPNADSSAGRTLSLTIIYGGAHTVTFTGGGVAGATTIKSGPTGLPAATSVSGKRDFYTLKVDLAGTHTSVLDAGRNF